MADHRLYLPPTQSQNSNIFASSMPNLVTNDLFVLQEMKVNKILMDKQFPRNQTKNGIKIPLPQGHKVFGNKARVFGGEKEPSLASFCVGDGLLMKNIEVGFTRISPYLRGECLRSDDK